jgi:uncharacterized protein involved in exopolysaccharide biosynthesis
VTTPLTGPASAEEVSLADLVRPLAHRWKLLVGLPLALGLLAGLLSLVLPSVYTAQTTITPVASTSGFSGNALSSLAGLAGQLGMTTGGGGSVTPDFISSVLKSREVLTATLESRFQNGEGQELPLLDILRVKGRNPAERLSRAVRLFGSAVQTKVDRATGIVTLTVKARDPRLAADVANRMRVILNDFNLDRRQSQSREQARFTKERLAQAETELRDAEAAQLRFLQTNRDYRNSPLLDFEASRLQRAVDLRQEVYVSLVKSYDEARISEVRDTPVITTIDSAVPPDHRSSPRPLLNTAVAILAGGLLAFVLVFLLEQRRHSLKPAAAGYQSRHVARSQETATAASEREQSPAGV